MISNKKRIGAKSKTFVKYLQNKSETGADNSFYIDSQELTTDFLKDPLINKFKHNFINESFYDDEDEKWMKSLASSNDF